MMLTFLSPAQASPLSSGLVELTAHSAFPLTNQLDIHILQVHIIAVGFSSQVCLLPAYRILWNINICPSQCIAQMSTALLHLTNRPAVKFYRYHFQCDDCISHHSSKPSSLALMVQQATSWSTDAFCLTESVIHREARSQSELPRPYISSWLGTFHCFSLNKI